MSDLLGRLEFKARHSTDPLWSEAAGELARLRESTAAQKAVIAKLKEKLARHEEVTKALAKVYSPERVVAEDALAEALENVKGGN